MNRRTLTIAASLAIIILATALVIIGQPIRFVDDSWITFRYADHLVHDGELTFNLGEKVEGISNLLWALVLAILGWSFHAPIHVVAAFAAMILLTYSLYRLWRIGIFLELDPLVATVPPLFLILTPDFYGVATNGLEMPLFMALLLDATYWSLRRRYALAFLFLGLLSLTRFEAAGIAIIFLATLLLSEPKKSQRKPLLMGFAIFAAIAAVAVIFRLSYYRDVLPNSIRAKQVALAPWLLGQGVRYVLDFVMHNPFYGIILAATLFYALREIRGSSIRVAIDKVGMGLSPLVIISAGPSYSPSS